MDGGHEPADERRAGRVRTWALLWVGLARVGLWVSSVPRVRALLRVLVRHSPSLRATPMAVQASVQAADRAVPRATCLVRALGAEALLLQAGVPCEVHLGVSAGTRFTAHAWVESDGRPIVGGGPGRHHRLGSLGDARGDGAAA